MPKAAIASAMRGASARSTAATSTITRKNITVQATRMPSASAAAWRGSWRLRCAKPSVTAVLETSPPSSPVRPMPCSAPTSFTSR